MSLFFCFVSAGVLFAVFYLLEIRSTSDGRWFAWRPVRCEDGSTAWLKLVNRCHVGSQAGDGETGHYEYWA